MFFNSLTLIRTFVGSLRSIFLATIALKPRLNVEWSNLCDRWSRDQKVGTLVLFVWIKYVIFGRTFQSFKNHFLFFDSRFSVKSAFSVQSFLID